MPKMPKTPKYGDKDIRVLKEHEKIRMNPGMYIGDPISEYGTFQVAKETISNAIDEAIGGYANQIDVYVEKGGKKITVVDNGRGIPQKSVVTIFTKIHSGGKFSGNENYVRSGGMHGVGAACANYLATSLQCWSKRDGKTVLATFKKGRVVKAEHRSALPNKKGAIIKHGTVVEFVIDKSILKYGKVPVKKLRQWLSDVAFVIPKLKIRLHYKGKIKTFYSKKGFAGLKKAKDIYYKTDGIELLLQIGAESMNGFVNVIPSSEGAHIAPIYTALKTSLKPFAGKRQTVPSVGSLRELIGGYVSVFVKSPIFEGQTKEKLSDTEGLSKRLGEAYQQAFTTYFKQNESSAKAILTQGAKIEKAAAAMKREIDATRKLRQANSGKLPAKMKISYVKKRDTVELFLVEGESAGGPVKSAVGKHQEVLPLKGKILNVFKAKMDKIVASDEVANIIKAIGKVEKPRVGKVIVLVDPDPDGGHIGSLLSSFFLKMYPEFLEAGKIYYIDLPLYHVLWKGKQYYGTSKQEVLDQTNGKGDPQYIKGLGEFKPSDLKLLACDEKTRKLVQIKVNDQSLKKTERLMGQDNSYRKELLGL